MNFKLKALVAAAVATMTLSGTANAIPLNNMFLVAYDTVTQNSFVADLGFAASTFTNTTLATPISYTGNSNWTTFTANSTAANTIYQVLGYDGGNNIYTTSNDITTPGATSKFNLASAGFGSGAVFSNFLTANTGATNYVASTAAFGKASEIGIDWATAFNNFTTVAALGTNDNFYKITKPAGARPATALVLTTYTGDTTANSYWNLSTTGVLSYTAPVTAAVPEADTSAMMLAGLGLMGFVARRRRAA